MKEHYQKLLVNEILEAWEESNTDQRVRSIFTTMCIACHMDADTEETDSLLNHLYDCGGLEHINIEYDVFVEFMVEFIV